MNEETAMKRLQTAITWMQRLGRHSELLGGLVADHIWFTPWPVPISPRAAAKQQSWLEATESFVTETTVGRIAGFTAGSGPGVLLVHGWGERAAALGAFIAPLVDNGYRVVAFDLPAHGSSSGRRTDALRIAAAIREISAEKEILFAIAHSMGGHATLVALRDGLALERVALLAPSIDFEHAMEGFRALFSPPEKVIRGLRRVIERKFGPNLWQDFMGERLVENVEVPALIVHDRNDEQVRFSDGERLAKAWSSATLHATQGLSHGGITRDPAVLARVVAFLGDGAGYLPVASAAGTSNDSTPSVLHVDEVSTASLSGNVPST